MSSKKRSGIHVSVLSTCLALIPARFKSGTAKRLTVLRLTSDVWSDVAHQMIAWTFSFVANNKTWIPRKNKFECKDYCILNIPTAHLRRGEVIEVTLARFAAAPSMLQCQAYLNSIVPRLERQGVTVLLTLRLSTIAAVKACGQTMGRQTKTDPVRLHRLQLVDDCLYLVAQDVATYVAVLVNFRHLDMSHMNIVNGMLKSVSGMTELLSLDVSGCGYINDTGMVHLAGLTKLVDLVVAPKYSASFLTDAGLDLVKVFAPGVTITRRNIHEYGDEVKKEVMSPYED